MNTNTIIINNLRKEAHGKIVNFLKQKDLCVHSFITIKIPPGVSRGILYQSLVQLIQLYNFGEYIYGFEVGVKTGHIHCHIGSSSSFFNIKDKLCNSFVLILQKLIWDKDIEISEQCFHYKNVTDDQWPTFISYILKDAVLPSNIKYINKVYQFGGSIGMKKILANHGFIRNTYLDGEEAAIVQNSKISSEVLDFDLIYNSTVLEYQTKHPIIDAELIRKQVMYELTSFTEKYNLFNFDKFMEFLAKSKTTVGSYYLDFYKALNVLVELHYASVVFSIELWYSGTKTSSKKKYRELFAQVFEIDSEAITCSRKFVIFLFSNVMLKVFKLNGSSKVEILKNLGSGILSLVCLDLSLWEENEILSVGNIIYELFRVSFVKTENSFILIEEIYDHNTTHLDFSGVFYNLLEDSSSKRVLMSFDSVKLSEICPEFTVDRKNMLLSMSFNLPTIVPPKNWTMQHIVSVKDDKHFSDLMKNTSGGFLLNGTLLKQPLGKQKPFSNHALAGSEKVLNTINKMQSFAYKIDTDLFDFYSKNLKSLPGLLSVSETKQKREELSTVKMQLKIKYTERKRLLLLKESNLCDMNSNLFKLTDRKNLLQEQLSHSETIRRLLHSWGLVDSNKSFYYVYHCDFRLRCYPSPHELSQVGSKFSRSLIRFESFGDFNVTEFKKYAVSQYIDSRSMSEFEILHTFDSDLAGVLQTYSTKSSVSTINNKAKEPFLLYACAVEWCRFVKFGCHSNYTSNFPIYYDCTAQGAQILTLIFNIKKFASYLNLCKIKDGSRGDFYTAVILKFFEFATSKQWGLEYISNPSRIIDTSFLSLLRKYLKNAIMVLFYGVSYHKFQKSFDVLCYTESNWDILHLVFNFNKETVVHFTKQFGTLFWDYTHSTETFPIFRIEPLLKAYRKRISASDLSLSVFDINIIKPRYLKVKRRQMDSKVFSKRERLVFYESDGALNENKLRTSMIANFTHALDAYILLELVSRFQFQIVTIHDSFGVLSCNVIDLRSLLREIYEFVRRRGYHYFAEKMASLIDESCSGSSSDFTGKEFLDFVLSTIPLGDEEGCLDYSDLSEAQIIYSA